MSDPESGEEYAKKFHANQRITGYGLETTMHLPCPFCAEPDFRVYRVIDSEIAWKEPAVCKHCERGLELVIERTATGTTMQFFQSSGPEQPRWSNMPRRG